MGISKLLVSILALVVAINLTEGHGNYSKCDNNCSPDNTKRVICHDEDEYTCVCDPGYHGTYCEQMCTSKCHPSNTKQTDWGRHCRYKCNCNPQVYGKNCEHKCSNKCHQTNTMETVWGKRCSHTCICHPQKYGKFCEDCNHACHSSSTKRVICRGNGGYRCVCKPSYTGKLCENQCRPDKCYEPNTLETVWIFRCKYFCKCKPQKYGKYCERDYCSDKCDLINTKYIYQPYHGNDCKCACEDGYYGKYCKYKCKSNCHKKNTLETIWFHRCKHGCLCKANYTGINCYHQRCSSSTYPVTQKKFKHSCHMVNTAYISCVISTDMYQCECKGGYYGKYCQYKCKNYCHKTNTKQTFWRYRCRHGCLCKQNYSGKHCQNKVIGIPGRGGK